MAESTLEEAGRCPKCNHPGERAGEQPAHPRSGLPRGTRLLTFYCRTQDCPWENTSWYVQVNPDGTVPPPQDHKPQSHLSVDKATMERVRESLRHQTEAERSGRGEVRNPFAR